MIDVGAPEGRARAAYRTRIQEVEQAMQRLCEAVNDCEAIRYELLARSPEQRPADQVELVEAVQGAWDVLRVGTGGER